MMIHVEVTSSNTENNLQQCLDSLSAWTLLVGQQHAKDIGIQYKVLWWQASSLSWSSNSGK